MRNDPPSDAIVVSSREVLRHHAKTFRFASLLLPPAVRDDAAIVYAFCRRVDDEVDEAPNEGLARAAMQEICGQLGGDLARDPLIAAFVEVCERCEIPLTVALELCEGVISDLGDVRFQSDRALIRYSYLVAGTVGLMMCGVLGVRDPRAHRHAVDLGIGMQLTNICRDVAEDAQRGRVYLPSDRLQAAGGSQEAVLAGEGNQAVAAVVEDLLRVADSYYESGNQGLRFIPGRSRGAIAAAGRMYRGIGDRLAAQGYDPFVGRAYVGVVGKVRWTLAGLAASVTSGLVRHRPHQSDLHLHLDGLTIGSTG